MMSISCLCLVFLYCFLEIIFENLYVGKTSVLGWHYLSVHFYFHFPSLLPSGFILSRAQHKVKDVLLRPPLGVCAELWPLPLSTVRWPGADADGVLPVCRWVFPICLMYHPGFQLSASASLCPRALSSSRMPGRLQCQRFPGSHTQPMTDGSWCMNVRTHFSLE